MGTSSSTSASSSRHNMMAFNICIMVILLVNLLVGAEGRVINEVDVINVPDEFPSRCDDPKTPCKCLDKISTKVVRDRKGVQHKISFVSHVCDVQKNKELEQPDNLKCEQITSDLYVYQLNKFTPYKSGCELRCVGECNDMIG